MSQGRASANDAVSAELLRSVVAQELLASQKQLDNYNKYKEFLGQALERFMSKAAVERTHEIQLHLRELLAELERDPPDGDRSDWIHELQLRNLSISKELHDISRTADVTDIPRPNLLIYNRLETQASEEYRNLSTKEALSVFPKTSVALILITIGFYFARFAHLIPKAFADQIESSPYFLRSILRLWLLQQCCLFSF